MAHDSSSPALGDALDAPENILLDDTPLSGVVLRGTHSPLEGVNVFNRYLGALVTCATVNRTPGASKKAIGYQIGLRWDDAVLSAAPGVNEEIPQLYHMIELNSKLRHELQSSATRYMPKSPFFGQVDLCSIIETLAESLCLYAQRGVLTRAIMLRGRKEAVQTTRQLDGFMPAVHSVYVPHNSVMFACPAAFSALVYAVSGLGQSVLTDHVLVDGATNAPILGIFNGHGLAHGCLVALRMLFYMYDLSGYGGVAALAFTRGIHKQATVVAATDEGGYMRDVLRSCTYTIPVGGIFVDDFKSYVFFPDVLEGDVAGFQALIDGALLKTAGAVALADPLIELEGRHYPSIFSVGARGQDGARVEMTEDECAKNSREIRRQITNRAGKFSKLYVELLGSIVVGDSGGGEIGQRAMLEMFSQVSQCRVNSHTVGPVVAPFFWVEPTSLFKHMDKTKATAESFGVLVGVNEHITRNAFPGADLLVPGGEWKGMAYEHRCTRAVPGLVHFYKRGADGLANYVPYQLFPHKVLLPGGGRAGWSGLAGTVKDAMRRGQSISSYSSEHGFCEVPGPAEFIYTGERISVRVKMTEIDPQAESPFERKDTHVIDPFSKDGDLVTYSARAPQDIGSGPMHNHGANIRRSRNLAAHVLTVAHDKKAMYSYISFDGPPKSMFHK